LHQHHTSAAAPTAIDSTFSRLKESNDPVTQGSRSAATLAECWNAVGIQILVGQASRA